MFGKTVFAARGIGVALGLSLTLPLPAQASVDGWYGRWQLQQVRGAPWVADQAVKRALPTGIAIRLAADAAEIPGMPACVDPDYSPLQSPPEGLFQGGLDHGRAAEMARAVGFAEGAVAGLRLDCANSSLDLHRLDEQTLVYALDNVLFTASRSPGALAEAGTPEAAVQDILVEHFAGDMAFTEALWAAKSHTLSPELNMALRDYFAAPWPQDEVPPINGDPLTDSQEYPTRFAVGAASQQGGRAQVPVRFADGWHAWTVTLVLVVKDAAWQLDDVLGRDGSGLRGILGERP